MSRASCAGSPGEKTLAPVVEGINETEEATAFWALLDIDKLPFFRPMPCEENRSFLNYTCAHFMHGPRVYHRNRANTHKSGLSF
ncbi:hypothetical protein BBP40_002152 [Aspergillus hancockii]|nr:hypothetical protein BBP40_002152 [Aspergillus hancockii]